MSFQIDLLIHAANVLYLFAFMVRDILWLRILAVVAAACLIPYFYFRPEPLMTPIYWNLVFAALNVYWICRLLLERLPVNLSADEQRLCELVFRTMTPRDRGALRPPAKGPRGSGRGAHSRGGPEGLSRAWIRRCLMTIGHPVASRTAPPPKLSNEEREARRRRAEELAPKYRIATLNRRPRVKVLALRDRRAVGLSALGAMRTWAADSPIGLGLS